jgi:dTMP kinase
MRGKLIVLEGIDGCGKNTQAKLLEKRIKRIGRRTAQVSIPSYGTPVGKILAEYLLGRIKIPVEVLSALFAANRYELKEKMEKALKTGAVVIADRYTSSGQAFQGALFNGWKRVEYAEWVAEMEGRLPKPNAIILLDVPPEITRKLLSKEKHKDIHERDLGYQKRVRQTYLWLARKGKWIVVKCVRAGKLRTKQEIHEEIWRRLTERKLI